MKSYFLKFPSAFLVAILSVCMASGVLAQVQRSFLNTGFESPVLNAPATGGCYVIVYDNAVPYWSSTAAVGALGGTCASPPVGTASGLIEMWTNGFLGVPARDGKQFVELNARESAALYQDVCIVNGESVSWALSHRGRSGIDTVAFVLGNSPTSIAPANIANTALTGGILRASTSTTGAGTIVSCQNGSSVTSTTACTKATTNTWADYRGVFTWNGSSGVKSIGFGAISTSDGNTSSGNFLDAITLTLKPYIEFNVVSASGLESVASPTTFGIRVTGNVTTALAVPVTVTGGTAILGTDFTTPGGGATFNVTIPAGSYSGTVIPIGITIVNDTLLEANETITFALSASTAASPYVTASTSTCGAAPLLSTTYTIVDDDRPTVSINKIRLGGTGTIAFGISGTNGVPGTVTNILTDANNASTSVAALTNLPITTDGVAVTFTETQPSAQWVLTSARCIDANAGNATLGNTNPSTNLATFTGNIVTIPAANVLHTSAFNCTVTNTRQYADITLRKTWVDAIAGNAVTVSATGLANLISVVNTPSETDSSPVQLVPLGSVVTLSEMMTTGVQSKYASTLACTGTAGLAGNSLTVAATDTAIECTYTNQRLSSALSISKTDSQSSSLTGDLNTYIIVVSNAGPGSIDGAIVKDIVGAGLTCLPTNTVTCSAVTGSVTCPAGPLTFANLLSGLTVATLPSASALQFSYTCVVN